MLGNNGLAPSEPGREGGCVRESCVRFAEPIPPRVCPSDGHGDASEGLGRLAWGEGCEGR